MPELPREKLNLGRDFTFEIEYYVSFKKNQCEMCVKWIVPVSPSYLSSYLQLGIAASLMPLLSAMLYWPLIVYCPADTGGGSYWPELLCVCSKGPSYHLYSFINYIYLARRQNMEQSCVLFFSSLFSLSLK